MPHACKKMLEAAGWVVLAIQKWLGRCRFWRPELGKRVLDLGTQAFDFEGAGTQICRHGEPGFGGALPQLRTLAFAKTNGDAGGPGWLRGCGGFEFAFAGRRICEG